MPQKSQARPADIPAVQTSSNSKLDHSCDPLPIPIRRALDKLHSADGRVVDLVIDGERCVIPFALALYLSGHGPYDKPRIWECQQSKTSWHRRIRVRPQAKEDELIWPITKMPAYRDLHGRTDWSEDRED